MRGRGSRNQETQKVLSAPDSKFSLLAHPHKPAPTVAEDTVSPAEIRIAIGVDAGKISVNVRIHPGGVGDSDRSPAIGLKILGLESLAPLALRNLAVLLEHPADHVEARLVTDLDELEMTGLGALHGRAVVLPLRRIVVAIPAHHLDRVVDGVITVECELEDLTCGGIRRIDHGLNQSHHCIGIERSFAHTLEPVVLLSREPAKHLVCDTLCHDELLSCLRSTIPCTMQG